LDWTYVQRELMRLGIDDYEMSVRHLAQKLFCEQSIEGTVLCDSISDEEKKEILYYLGSGTYGTQDHDVQNKLKKISADEKIRTADRFRYIFRRIFPSPAYFYKAYPCTKKNCLLIPVCWMYRIYKAIFRNGKQTLFENKLIWKSKNG